MWILDLRPELPDAFRREDREAYAKNLEKLYENLKEVEPLAPMTEVEIVDDIDLQRGAGRESGRIGQRAVVKGNAMWLNGKGGGSGATPDPLHPRAMTFNEMHVRDGAIGNIGGDLDEYLLVFGYESQLRWGGSSAWWPRAALRVVSKEEKRND